MAGFILGKKDLQTQMFDQKKNLVPVTKIDIKTCTLVALKSNEVHGYTAAVLGFGHTKKIGKSVNGQYKKAGIKSPLRFLREIRLNLKKSVFQIIEEEGKAGLQIGEVKIFVGDEIKPSVLFTAGEKVCVSGNSKGKGFQGVVKRHGFSGGPRTHGQSDRERAPGSIGSTTTPGRVLKGLRMAGRMGGGRNTVVNLEVLLVDDDSITIKGLIPGYRGGLVELRSKEI